MPELLAKPSLGVLGIVLAPYVPQQRNSGRQISGAAEICSSTLQSFTLLLLSEAAETTKFHTIRH